MQTLLPLAETIARQLKARGETIAVAESSAGGLIAAALLAVPGASAYFLGGAVVYTRQARSALVGISAHVVVMLRALMADPWVRSRGLSVTQVSEEVGDIVYPGPSPRLSETPVRLGLPGLHNVMNALAVAALCHHAGAPLPAIRAAA